MFVIGFITQYTAEKNANMAEMEALSKSDPPIACKDTDDMSWTEWMYQPGEEIRHEQCHQYLTRLYTRSVWPNPFMVLIKYVTLVIILPLNVAFDSMYTLYFQMIVKLGVNAACTLVVIVLVWLVYVIKGVRQTRKSIYYNNNNHSGYTIHPTYAVNELERDHDCEAGSAVRLIEPPQQKHKRVESISTTTRKRKVAVSILRPINVDNDNNNDDEEEKRKFEELF